MEKFDQFRARQKTIVIVSHDLDSVERLCDRAMLLHRGQVRTLGKTRDAIIDYHRLVARMQRQQEKEERQRREAAEAAARKAAKKGKGGSQATAEAEEPFREERERIVYSDDRSRWGTGEVEILGVEFLDRRGEEETDFRTGEKLVARIRFRAHQEVREPVFGVALFTREGVQINGPNTFYSGYPIPRLSAGEGHIDYIVESLPLLTGEYLFTSAVYRKDLRTPFDHQERRHAFRVIEGPVRERLGLVQLPGRWELGGGPGGAEPRRSVMSPGEPGGPGGGGRGEG